MSVRVVHVTTSDVQGGAARAASRLHGALLAAGVDSILLARDRQGAVPGTVGMASVVGRSLASAGGLVESLLIPRLYPHRTRQYFTAGLVPDGLASRVRTIGADVVHLHWVGNGFLAPRTVAAFGVPVVWTLHDANPFTGGCHVPDDCLRFEERCGRCPALGSTRERDLSRLVHRRKERAWRLARPTFVAPSRWMAGRARRSSLLRDQRIETIANGVDTRLFQPGRARARTRLGISASEKIVLYGALGGATDPNKGFALLAGALERLALAGTPRGLQLLVAGASEVPWIPPGGVAVRALGRLASEQEMAEVTAAADVVAIPSRLENLPNAALEAHACGTPVVAFRAGGTPDVVLDRRTGALAEPYDVEALAAAIRWVLEDGERHRELSRAARVRADAEFTIERQAGRVRALYEELVGR